MEVPLHAVMVQVFQRWPLRLLVDVGEGRPETVSEALFFDAAGLIFDTPGVELVPFRVPAPEKKDLISV